MPPRRSRRRARSILAEDDDVSYAQLLQTMHDQAKAAVDATAQPPPSSSQRSPPKSREELVSRLSGWNFSPTDLSHEDLVQCAILIFEALWRVHGLEESLVYSADGQGLVFERIPTLVYHLSRLYLPLPTQAGASSAQQMENPYHNFTHAVDVLQATYSFLLPSGLVPPISILLEKSSRWPVPPNAPLQPLELFVLCLAAIGHDVGHPGWAIPGISAANREALHPLTSLHSTSPLEQLHLTIFLQTLRYHGFAPLLDSERILPSQQRQGQYIRFLLTHTILATDMALHDEFVGKLQSWPPSTSGPEVDEAQNATLLLLQALIKASDISNPLRPMPVPLFWSARLIKEWSEAARMERTLSDSLETKTIAMDFLVRDPADEDLEMDPKSGTADSTEHQSYLPPHAHISEANCQVFFIKRYLGPLLGFRPLTDDDAGVEEEKYPWLDIPVFREMKRFADEGQLNLEWWNRRLDMLKTDAAARRARRKRRSVTIASLNASRGASPSPSVGTRDKEKPVLKPEHVANRMEQVFPLCKPYTYDGYRERRRCLGSVLLDANRMTKWTTFNPTPSSSRDEPVSSPVETSQTHARRHSRRVSLGKAILSLIGAEEDDDESGDSDYHSAFSDFEDSDEDDEFAAEDDVDPDETLDADADPTPAESLTPSGGVAVERGLGVRFTQNQSPLSLSDDQDERRKAWTTLLNHAPVAPAAGSAIGFGFITPPPSPPLPFGPAHGHTHIPLLPPLSVSTNGISSRMNGFTHPFAHGHHDSSSSSFISPVSEKVFSPFSTGTASSARTSSEGDRLSRRGSAPGRQPLVPEEEGLLHSPSISPSTSPKGKVIDIEHSLARKTSLLWAKLGGKINSKGVIGKRKSWSGAGLGTQER